MVVDNAGGETVISDRLAAGEMSYLGHRVDHNYQLAGMLGFNSFEDAFDPRGILKVNAQRYFAGEARARAVMAAFYSRLAQVALDTFGDILPAKVTAARELELRQETESLVLGAVYDVLGDLDDGVLYGAICDAVEDRKRAQQEQGQLT